MATVSDLEGLVVLTLTGPGTERKFWVRGEEIEAVSTEVPHESLLDQARRDGLIDTRQEAALRPVRLAAPSGVVRALTERGLVQAQEVAPLLGRHADAVAVAALGEAEVGYEIRRENQLPVEPLPEPRPLAPLLAEALRKGSLVDAASLRDLGAARVLPGPAFDARERFGLNERERRMLRLVDGTRNVEELLEEPGGWPEWALRAWGWWKSLQLVIVEPVPPLVAADLPENLARLTSKLAEAEESDYFAILGVSRQATRHEVQQAFHQLVEEFGPMHFDGHSDARVRRSAEKLREVLSEAAQVLSDDRLRAEYARNLLD
jgi:hypothetical protein